MGISGVTQVVWKPARTAAMQPADGAADIQLVAHSTGKQSQEVAQPEPQHGSQIRVLLADDHRILREGLTRLLQIQPDIRVVGQAVDGQQAVDLALQLQPDVVIMDVVMPGVDGIEATRRIHSLLPHVRVIGLSMHDEAEVAGAMSAAGATAYLAKTAPPAALIAMIRNSMSPPMN